MTLKELFNIVEFEDVWEELIMREYVSGIDRGAYRSAYNRLNKLKPAPNPESYCLAVSENENESSSGGLSLDISCVKPGDSGCYSFAASFWEECLSLEVLKDIIEKYGYTTIAALAFYEMMNYSLMELGKGDSETAQNHRRTPCRILWKAD